MSEQKKRRNKQKEQTKNIDSWQQEEEEEQQRKGGESNSTSMSDAPINNPIDAKPTPNPPQSTPARRDAGRISASTPLRPLPVSPSPSPPTTVAPSAAAARTLSASSSAASASGAVNVIRPKERTAGVSTSMTAKAARESNLASSLTSYLQNQLSLLSKRGHAREVLKMLELKDDINMAEDGAAYRAGLEEDMQAAQAHMEMTRPMTSEPASTGGLVYAPMLSRRLGSDSFTSPRPHSHQLSQQATPSSLAAPTGSDTICYPSGSSNPYLPTIPTARLNLPSQLWAATNDAAPKPPEDSLTQKAHVSYARLAQQRTWLRRREEKEEECFRTGGGAPSPSPASWQSPYQDRGPESAGHDGFGRRMMNGVASEDDKMRRLQHMTKTNGDPIPCGTGINSIRQVYNSQPVRDVRPYVSGQVHLGADRNALLDYDVMRVRDHHKWSTLLSQARADVAMPDTPHNIYPSGSQSARPSNSAPASSSSAGRVRRRDRLLPSGFEAQQISQITSINPPRPPRSFNRNRTALAYRLNNGSAGVFDASNVAGGDSNSHGSHSANSRTAARFRHAAAIKTPHPPYQLPQQTMVANIYSTSGFTPADLGLHWPDDDDDDLASTGAVYGSFSATGGFQRVRSPLVGGVLQSPSGVRSASDPAAADLARWKSSLLEKGPPPAELPNTHASVFHEPDQPNAREQDQSLAALLDFSDRNGSTPLFHAAWEGFTQIIALLCEYGADVNVRNVRRHTAMDMAVERSHIDVVRILIRFGSDATYVEAKAARHRCHARLGQTYSNWLKRMRAGRFLPDSADGAEQPIQTANLPTDAETQYYLPIHVALQQTDRDILKHFSHTIFHPDDGSFYTPLEARSNAIRHLTRDARVARARKLASERINITKLRKRNLGGDAPRLANSAAGKSRRSASQADSDFDRTRSVIGHLPSVRERRPTVAVGANTNNANQPAAAPMTPTSLPDGDDNLADYEADLTQMKAEIERQRQFYADQSSAILRHRVERDASYSAFEAWVDELDLAQAVMVGDLPTVERILIAHPEHSAIMTHGCSLLYHAAYHGWYSIARALLAASVEHRLDRGLESAAARAVSLVTDGQIDPQFADPAHPFFDPEVDIDGGIKPPAERMVHFAANGNEEGTTQTGWDQHHPATLDVNLLCIDQLKTSEEMQLDDAIRKQMEVRSGNRLLRRTLQAKKDQARKARDEEEQKRRDLGLSDSDSDSDGDGDDSKYAPVASPSHRTRDHAGAGRLASPPASSLDSHARRQRELDDLIDVPFGHPPNPLQFQLWHEWYVKPKDWNLRLRRRMNEWAAARGIANATQQHTQLRDIIEQQEEEFERDTRYETAIYVAIRRKNYRLALLLHQFGAISPYKQSDLLLLCDIQLRARRLMAAIRSANYGLIQSILASAQGPTGGVLQQLLQYQDTNGSNPILLSIQKNDLRILDLLKSSTLTLGSKVHASRQGESVFGRLLSTIKDRLGHTALEKSLLTSAAAAAGAGDATSGAAKSSSADITSYLLSQGGLVLQTKHVLELLLLRNDDSSVAGGPPGGSVSSINSGGRWEVNKAGLDKLRQILLTSIPGKVTPLSSTATSGASTPTSTSIAANPPQPDVINFTELHAQLNANPFNLRSEEMAELRESVLEIEDKYKALKVLRQKKVGPSSADSSPHISRRNLHATSAASLQTSDPDLQPWSAELHMVHEGLEPSESAAVLPLVSATGEIDFIDVAGVGEDDDAMRMETEALQKQIAQVEAAEAAKEMAKEMQKSQLEQLKAAVLADRSDDESTDDDADANGGSANSPPASDVDDGALDSLLSSGVPGSGSVDGSARIDSSSGRRRRTQPAQPNEDDEIDEDDNESDDAHDEDEDDGGVGSPDHDANLHSPPSVTSKQPKVHFSPSSKTQTKKSTRAAATSFSVPAAALGIPVTRRGSGKRGPVLDVSIVPPIVLPPPAPVLPDLFSLDLKARLVWVLDEVAEVQQILPEFTRLQRAVARTQVKQANEGDNKRHDAAHNQPMGNPFVQVLANAHAAALQRIDAGSVRWTQMLRVNPFLYQLMGVDYPLDAPRVLTLDEINAMSSAAQPPAASTAPSRRHSQDQGQNNNTTTPQVQPLPQPQSQAQSRRGSTDGSPVVILRDPSRPTSAFDSPVTSPNRSIRSLKPQSSKRSAPPLPPAAVSKPRDLLPHERVDPPDRTITLASWLESFQRLAREAGGVRAVTEVLDEFQRVAKLIRAEVNQERVERKKREAEGANTPLQPLAILARHRIQSNSHVTARSHDSAAAGNSLYSTEVDLSDVDSRALSGSDFLSGALLSPVRPSVHSSLSVGAPPTAPANSIFAFVPHLDPHRAPPQQQLTEAAAAAALRAIHAHANTNRSEPSHITRDIVTDTQQYRTTDDTNGIDEDEQTTRREQLQSQLQAQLEHN